MIYFRRCTRASPAVITALAFLFLSTSSGVGQDAGDKLPPPPDGVYHPAIVLGNSKLEKRLVFLWGSNQRSADIFKYYILPLVSDPERRQKIHVVLTQYLLDDKIDYRGPGALLFCSDQRAYAQLALTYLQTGVLLDQRKPISGGIEKNFYGNPTILEDLKINRVELKECLQGKDFYRRTAFMIGLSYKMRELAHIKKLPVIIWEGRSIEADDAAGLQSIAKLAQ